MSYYSFIYLLKLNIVGDFTKMNFESEKSTESAAPLWKYVTNSEKKQVPVVGMYSKHFMYITLGVSLLICSSYII